MQASKKPQVKPSQPNFSSGPCAKRPGWDLTRVKQSAYLGRSHRAKDTKYQIKQVISMTRHVLEIPDNYIIGIVPASNTGAFEMAMWNLIGHLPVDIFAWENFGLEWAHDVINQLKIKDYRLISSDYGVLPDLSLLRENSDVCFTWNGTTSGVRVPDANWIPSDREGLVLCDATSAVFGQKVDWIKLDAITFSWQKGMGGEAAHGMLVLSPKAVERLRRYTPDWPLPKIFRLLKNGDLIEGIFSDETINTPSMLCVADALDSLQWIKELGGADSTIARANANFDTLQLWVDQQDWIQNLVEISAHRSNTSVCLKIIDPDFTGLSLNNQWDFIKYFVFLLENEDVAYDIAGHRKAPPGLRIWCGATIEANDLRDLLPWLSWAFKRSKEKFGPFQKL